MEGTVADKVQVDTYRVVHECLDASDEWGVCGGLRGTVVHGDQAVEQRR